MAYDEEARKSLKDDAILNFPSVEEEELSDGEGVGGGGDGQNKTGYRGKTDHVLPLLLLLLPLLLLLLFVVFRC